MLEVEQFLLRRALSDAEKMSAGNLQARLWREKIPMSVRR